MALIITVHSKRKRKTGIIKSFSYSNNYGFINTENGDYYFQGWDMEGKCKVGEKVSFLPLENNRAKKVRIG